MVEALAIRPLAQPRALVDLYCQLCGMFLASTDAPPGKRVRVICRSKRCKGKVREVIVGMAPAPMR